MVMTLARILAEEFEGDPWAAADPGDVSAAVERALMIVRGTITDTSGSEPLFGFDVMEALLGPFLGVGAARLEAAEPIEAIHAGREPKARGGARPCLDVRLSAHLLRELAEIWGQSPGERRLR
jgi:hypothetical protein